MKRAVDSVENLFANDSHNIAIMGSLIHNPQVVEHFASKGLRQITSLEEVGDSRLAIRTHGIEKPIFYSIVEKRIAFEDLTCPFVKKAQSFVEQLAKDDYHIMLIGDRDHPEVKSLYSYAPPGQCTIIAVPRDVATLKNKRFRKLGVVAQTTQSQSNLTEIVSRLLPLADELRVFNTICNATDIRQQETSRLAGTVDAMIVVGGKNSANTTRLAEISRAIQPLTFHVESTEEIDGLALDGVRSVGITAGASTPNWIIDNVVKKLHARERNTIQESYS